MIDFTEIEFHKDDLEELRKLEIDFAFQPIFRASDMSIFFYKFRRFLYFIPSHHEFIAKIRYNKRMDMYIQKSAKGRRSL